ncbi:MAG: transporter substrate-binding protein [Gallionella sp.]|nr:transporter substrate-binding protein [Gallionella sp.]
MQPGKINLLVAIVTAVVLLFAALLYSQYGKSKPNIRIGLLHSLTGTMAVSEATLVNVVRLASAALLGNDTPLGKSWHSAGSHLPPSVSVAHAVGKSQGVAGFVSGNGGDANIVAARKT